MNRYVFLTVCLLSGVVVGVAFHLGGRHTASSVSALSPLARTHAVSLPATSANPPDSTRLVLLDEDAPAPDTATNASLAPTAPPVHSYHAGIMRAAPSVVSLYASIDDEKSIAPEGLTRRLVDTADSTTNGTTSAAIPANAARRLLSQGSGVVVDPEGIVVTNLHLVEGAELINVVLANGALHTGWVVGSDRETDLAVIRIEASDLPAVSLDEAAPLRVGDVVLAIGNPFGVGQTVTQGIVSATRRRIAGGSARQDFVQIDAAINPGNSGGALINPAGQLVGVTTAVFRRPTHLDDSVTPLGDGEIAEGIGFAIPAELLARVIPELITRGYVARGWLGLGVDDLPMYPGLHRRFERGAVITHVLADSPAAAAGLAPRDIVTRVDTRDIVDASGFLRLISSLTPGTEISLEVIRGDAARTVSIGIGERPLADGVGGTR